MNKSILLRTVILCMQCIHYSAPAQSLPAEIRYEALNIRALRYHPDATDATDIMKKVIRNKPLNDYRNVGYCTYTRYQKTSTDLLANKQSIGEQLASSQQNNPLIYNYFVRPYEPWIGYARPSEKQPAFQALTIQLSEDYRTVCEDGRGGRRRSVLHATREEGVFDTTGRQDLACLSDEVFEDIDLYRDRNEILSLPFKSPLGDQALNTYVYRLTGIRQVGEQRCYEIAFYCENRKENAFAGYFYISTDETYSVVEAHFTLNNPDAAGGLRNVLITHTYLNKENRAIPSVKKYAFLLGDDVKGSLIVERTVVFRDFDFATQQESYCWENSCDRESADRDEFYWRKIRPVALTPAQEQIRELSATAAATPAFRNLQKAMFVFLNNRFPIGDGSNGLFDLGPLTPLVNYNRMEGLRLRIGGNTTPHLLNRLQIGGYAAYGTSDKALKYRADLIYSLLPRKRYMEEFPRRLISFAYVSDLNVPGQNLLTSVRDHLLNSFSDASVRNMSLQKIGSLTYENELSRHFSFKIGGRYTYDEPKGVVRYMQVQQHGDTAKINAVTTAEAQFSVRISPGEKFIRIHNKRIYIRRGDVEINLSHRIGAKGLLGSDYGYQITELKGFKSLNLDAVGDLDVQLSAGKIWNRLPFPLLFIPEGNQSYIFEEDGYNCMRYYEFVTDNYAAGRVNFMFNWSPMKWLNHKNNIRTSIGTRMIYGPLSDNNDPTLHPELFMFNSDVNPLGHTPYAEAHIGFTNIFKILRIEYARRLTYVNRSEKGSLLLGACFPF